MNRSKLAKVKLRILAITVNADSGRNERILTIKCNATPVVMRPCSIRMWHFAAVARRSHRKRTADATGVVEPGSLVGASSTFAPARLSIPATIEARFA
jgi:hypothetical protein